MADAEHEESSSEAVNYRHFSEMLTKAQLGMCCLLNCNEPSALGRSTPFSPNPPILCQKHLRSPEDTHTGKWVPTANPYYENWTCCKQIYKLTVCTKLSDAFSPYASTIRATEEQIQRANQQQLEEQRIRDDWDRLIAMGNAGHDEAYDR